MGVVVVLGLPLLTEREITDQGVRAALLAAAALLNARFEFPARRITVNLAPADLPTLRKERDGNRPKVIFCTTENDVEHITRAITAGANEYIMKPFDREIIEAKFHEVGLI